MARQTVDEIVHELSTQALWYAWGRIDSGVMHGPDTDYAFAFRDWYGELARKYAAGEAWSRPAIMFEFERFVSAGRVG